MKNSNNTSVKPTKKTIPKFLKSCLKPKNTLLVLKSKRSTYKLCKINFITTKTPQGLKS